MKKTTKENLIFAIIIVTQTVLWLALGVCGCLVAYGIGRIIGGGRRMKRTMENCSLIRKYGEPGRYAVYLVWDEA